LDMGSRWVPVALDDNTFGNTLLFGSKWLCRQATDHLELPLRECYDTGCWSFRLTGRRGSPAEHRRGGEEAAERLSSPLIRESAWRAGRPSDTVAM